MALALIDKTKEEACRTAEADAIRAKTGDSADIAFDFDNEKGFADAIAAIETGGGLEPLSNPATAGTIIQGYEAYGDDGEVIEGTVPYLSYGADICICGISHAHTEFNTQFFD